MRATDLTADIDQTLNPGAGLTLVLGLDVEDQIGVGYVGVVAGNHPVDRQEEGSIAKNSKSRAFRVQQKPTATCQAGRQTAAGSALSQMVRNLAVAHGFRVIDVVRSRAGADRLKQANSKHVVALEDEDLLGAIHRIAPGGVDYVLDCVGGATGSEVLRTLAPGGRMVCYGTLSRQPISLPPRDIMMPMTSIEGFYLSAYLAKRTLFQRIGLVRKTAKLIESGVLGTSVEQTYRLDDLHAALEHARRPGRTGKVLLDLT